jgi:hypothetical protein
MCLDRCPAHKQGGGHFRVRGARPIATATSRSRSVRIPSRRTATRRRSDAWAWPKWESSLRVTDGETIASPEAIRRTALMISPGWLYSTQTDAV